MGLELATKFIENSSKSFLESHLLDQKPTLTLVMKYHQKKTHCCVTPCAPPQDPIAPLPLKRGKSHRHLHFF